MGQDSRGQGRGELVEGKARLLPPVELKHNDGIAVP